MTKAFQCDFCHTYYPSKPTWTIKEGFLGETGYSGCNYDVCFKCVQLIKNTLQQVPFETLGRKGE